MILSEVRGNIFNAPKNVMLGHCIAADAGMGRGIAVDFVHNFPQIKRLRQMDLEVGKTYFVSPVYNIVTKRRSPGKPNYDTMCAALGSLKEQCISNNTKFLGIPKIGCGLDRLQWPAVREILKYQFNDVDIEIVVYHL